VFNLHDTNHVNRGITRVRLLKQVKADEKWISVSFLFSPT
jgi:hypothetical protein